MAYYSNKPKKQYDTDLSQIAFITNRKQLVSACDYLQVTDLEDEFPDKCPASMHARYSRIKIMVTNFDVNPTVCVNFNVKPSEIRLLFEKVKLTSISDRPFEWKQIKDMKLVGGEGTESITIKRVQAMKDGKEVVGYPWSFAIAQNVGGEKKFAAKSVSDDEMFQFLGDIVAYINVWEMTFGAPLIRKVIEPFKEKRSEDIKAAREAKKSGATGGSYNNAPRQQQAQKATPAPPPAFDDEPL